MFASFKVEPLASSEALLLLTSLLWSTCTCFLLSMIYLHHTYTCFTLKLWFFSTRLQSKIWEGYILISIITANGSHDFLDENNVKKCKSKKPNSGLNFYLALRGNVIQYPKKWVIFCYVSITFTGIVWWKWRSHIQKFCWLVVHTEVFSSSVEESTRWSANDVGTFHQQLN